jgi:hypothetical protein
LQLIEPTRDKPALAGALVLGVALLLIFLSFSQIYYIGGSGDGDLLWNQNEAYLFVHGERRGYHVSYLGYVGELVKEYFGVIDSPNDVKPFTAITKITSSSIERYETVGTFDFYTPLGQNIYALHDQAPLWKWVGTHFEEASAQDQQALGNAARLPKRDFTDVSGWSARYSITAKIKEQFTIQLDSRPITVAVTTLNLADGQVSVDVFRPDHPPEAVFHRNGRPRRVSRTEYERVFRSTN